MIGRTENERLSPDISLAFSGLLSRFTRENSLASSGIYLIRRISMQNMSKSSAGNLNSSAGKILSFLNLLEVQKVEWVFTIVWILNGVNAFSRYQPSSQANGQINVFYHGWGKFTNSSFSDALECFFSTLNKTSPWLKKIFKFHLLQRSRFRLLSSKKLHHTLKKTFKIHLLERSKMAF